MNIHTYSSLKKLYQTKHLYSNITLNSENQRKINGQELCILLNCRKSYINCNKTGNKAINA